MTETERLRQEVADALQIIRFYAHQAYYKSKEDFDLPIMAGDEGYRARAFLQKRINEKQKSATSADPI